MKSTTFKNMENFFDKVKTIGFFERIFGWKSIVTLSYDAFGEFQTIDKTLSDTAEKIDKADSEAKLMRKEIDNQKENKLNAEKERDYLKLKIDETNKDIQKKESEIGKYKESDKKNTKRLSELTKDVEIFKLKIDGTNKDIQKKESEIGKYKESDVKNTKRIQELSTEVELLKSRKDDLILKNKDLEKENNTNKELESQKQADYEKKVAELNSLKQQLDDDRVKIQDEREEEITNDIERQKQIWKNHEAKVEDSIKTICSRHQIEYLDKESVPFKGKPDNTVQICGEYIIFDAKSPQSDDLTNFKTYIRSQAEALKKYTKQKDVKRDIYLVIPFNTLEKIDQFYFNMTDYTVYVITTDSVEPI
ncbi:MAG: hypothetical protein KAS11_01050, partial [Candidatus Aenigmarchaeota archaeon]|nr:hypothetical protein [Candidatus Aenigmarchaeota archaeon]